jgi:hypothetical protein
MDPIKSELCCQVNPKKRCTLCNMPLCKDHLDARLQQKVRLGEAVWPYLQAPNKPCTPNEDVVFDGHFF